MGALFRQQVSFALLSLLLLGSAPPSALGAKAPLCSETYADLLGFQERFPEAEHHRVLRLIAERKAHIAYPEVPPVAELRLPKTAPFPLVENAAPSAGLADPLLEKARRAHAFDDFKPLSDARPKTLSAAKRKRLEAEARALAAQAGKAGTQEYEAAYLKALIERTYDFRSELVEVKGAERPIWRLESGSGALRDAFAYTELMWGKLLRATRPQKGSSLLSTPYEMLVPGGRFQETYYWDTYFGMKGLLATGRLELAQKQTENLLSFVRRYGFVPNGNRDYYLTRSQPPFLSSAVREVFEASWKEAQTAAERARLKKWLKERAFPLVKGDYQNFWLKAETRLDPRTGLAHHWDDADLPRPERHGHDQEETIGRTYRDVRAGAESGLDFTDAHEGETTAIAPVLLNSMLFKTEEDLAWMAALAGEEKLAANYEFAAKIRAERMRKFLWNEKEGRFDNYNLRTGKKVDALTADTFAPLFVGMASPEEAARVKNLALPALERKAGIKASNLDASIHQWDGPNGWAPQQVMATAGLKNYGYEKDAERLARKWTGAIAKLHEENKAIYERVDVATAAKPERDEKKYPTQEGFLWTNSSYVWMLLDILHEKKAPLP